MAIRGITKAINSWKSFDVSFATKSLVHATQSRGIAALTSSSTLPRSAPRAGTRHWTRLRAHAVIRPAACSHPSYSRVSAAIENITVNSTPKKVTIVTANFGKSCFTESGNIRRIINEIFPLFLLLWFKLIIHLFYQHAMSWKI